MITKTSDELHRVHKDVLKAVGTPDDIATIVADILVGAHLAGHDSHGIQHLPRYVQEVGEGHIVPAARPEIVSEKGSVVFARGNWGWGHFTAHFLTDVAIKRAKEHGKIGDGKIGGKIGDGEDRGQLPNSGKGEDRGQLPNSETYLTQTARLRMRIGRRSFEPGRECGRGLWWEDRGKIGDGRSGKIGDSSRTRKPI